VTLISTDFAPSSPEDMIQNVRDHVSAPFSAQLMVILTTFGLMRRCWQHFANTLAGGERRG
jgi:hypothetical protein